ncbi:MAG TPA: cytochrome-c peroxidase [Thermomicrobiales bacterium]|nr:cytochrome-c peroxidase [Thermomicrobiales bacterium]
MVSWKYMPAAAAVVGVSGWLTATSGTGADGEALLESARQQFEPIPTEPPELPGIPGTPEMVGLGTMLYFDPRLSLSGTISCNSCHIVGMGGVDVQEKSIGHLWQPGGRNAPTVLNAIFNISQFWDGRAKDLAEQAGGPVVNPIEMASTPERTVAVLQSIPGYIEAFAGAFPGETEPVTLENAQKTIAAFEATLITPNAPFDRFLRGDISALDEREKQGLALFMEAGCSTCHNGINVGGQRYATFGAVAEPGEDLRPLDDEGRFLVTGSANDSYSFKVPTLRNIALTPPYFHSGQIWDLREAVKVMGASQLGAELSEGEIAQITAFLGSLTGEQPEVVFPTLPPSSPTTPRPEPFTAIP